MGTVSKKRMIIYAMALVGAALVLFLSCDRRNSVTRSKPTPSFSVDLTAVRDVSRGLDVVDVQFSRDGQLFPDAIIKVGETVIPSQGNGRYYAQSPGVRLNTGGNSISFSSPDDNYSQLTSIDIPDTFRVLNINPQYSFGSNVDLQWSRPSGANHVILVMLGRQYPQSGTPLLQVIFDADVTTYTVLDTMFEDSIGVVVPDTYLLYMAAYNQGFGDYEGLDYPLPHGLPQRRILDPSGFLRYGTVAPIDSIVVRR